MLYDVSINIIHLSTTPLSNMKTGSSPKRSETKVVEKYRTEFGYKKKSQPLNKPQGTIKSTAEICPKDHFKLYTQQSFMEEWPKKATA